MINFQKLYNFILWRFYTAKRPSVIQFCAQLDFISAVCLSEYASLTVMEAHVLTLGLNALSDLNVARNVISHSLCRGGYHLYLVISLAEIAIESIGTVIIIRCASGHTVGEVVAQLLAVEEYLCLTAKALELDIFKSVCANYLCGKFPGLAVCCKSECLHYITFFIINQYLCKNTLRYNKLS